MVSKQKIEEILRGYGSELTICTVCSHSSLQIFYGAKLEGFNTLGLAIGEIPRFYDAFPKGKPNDFILVDDYTEISRKTEELIERNAVLIPHGSFVEYLTPQRFERLEVPTFGNRRVLEWESDRAKERQWLVSSGVDMPREIENPEDINRPVLVKYHGAKGGKGFFIARSKKDFDGKIERNKDFTIQEYVVGTRYYLHFFYSPIGDEGYRLSKGTLELLGADRRDESNVDGLSRLGGIENFGDLNISPTYVVTGNIPLILRESLLPRVFDVGEKVVERSLKLFGGMIGPFCLETIITDKLELKVFEISSRIVAGTTLFISGSPYSDLIEEKLSTGRRISKEIRRGLETNRLLEILS